MTDIKSMPIPRGSAARPGYVLAPAYITIHNTANAAKGAGAESHGLYMTKNGGQNSQVSYHFVVDDALIVQLLPETESAWHAGDGANGTGNRKSLAIEICENPESDLRKATDNAAELTALLMKRWGIPLERVVQHNHWSGKDCPHLIRAGNPYGWSTFLAHTRAFYDTLCRPGPDAPAQAAPAYIVQAGAFKSKGNALVYAEELKKRGVSCWVHRSGEYWRVQAGAFAEKQNAQTLAAALTQECIEACVLQKNA